MSGGRDLSTHTCTLKTVAIMLIMFVNVNQSILSLNLLFIVHYILFYSTLVIACILFIFGIHITMINSLLLTHSL